MLHAYCIRRAGEPAPGAGLSGVDGAAVELVEAEGLGLWISAAPEAAVTVDRLREHDRVVRAALRSATPLPIRYGTGFADAERAVEALRERREEYLAALDRVAGRVEMGIRVCWDPPPDAEGGAEEEGAPPAGAGPGRAYLERRRRQSSRSQATRARAEEVLRGVDELFRDMDLPAVHRVLPEEGVAGSVAHLVHRGQLGQYRVRLRCAENVSFPVRLLPSGPWAPYSFV